MRLCQLCQEGLKQNCVGTANLSEDTGGGNRHEMRLIHFSRTVFGAVGCAFESRTVSPARLSWGVGRRSHAVTERDAKTNGYNWTATHAKCHRNTA